MKINRRNPAHWLLLIQQLVYTLVVIGLRVFQRNKNRTSIVLYGHNFSGNLKALYEAWTGLGSEGQMYFLSLDPENADVLEQAGINVLRCNRLRDMLRLRSAGVIVTDHGLHLMSPLIRWSNIKFIDVWHGIPYKGFVPEDFKLQHRYDEVWVSSPLLKSLYESQFGFEPQRVVSLGYARTDKLFQARADSRSDPRSGEPTSSGKTVLFAPTWRQDSKGRDMFPFGESSQRFLEEIASVCAKQGAKLVVRAHLNAEIENTDNGNIVFCSQRDAPDTEEILLETDVLICDWSSIAFDFLALDRPTIFLDVPSPFENGFSLGPEYRFGSVVGDLENLSQELESFLRSPEKYLELYGEKHARVTADIYQGNTKGNAARMQLQRLGNFATTQKNPPSTTSH